MSKRFYNKKKLFKKISFKKSYKRSDGTRVKGSFVARTKVGRSCTPDKGKPGKTPKSQRILPKPGKDISLSKYGYSTHKSKKEDKNL